MPEVETNSKRPGPFQAGNRQRPGFPMSRPCSGPAADSKLDGEDSDRSPGARRQWHCLK